MARGGRIRFLDQVSISSPQAVSGGGDGVTITNNDASGRILTTSGENNVINGNTDIIFVGGKLGIGTNGATPQAILEVNGVSTDLILIKNEDGNGVKFTSEGILQLLPYSGTSTPIEGGIMFSGSEFFYGV
jgi:hypothetical protein